MKEPIFSGPSGRHPGRIKYVDNNEQPKVGEYVEFPDGARHKILEVRGNKARINSPPMGDHWVDISPHNRQLLDVEHKFRDDVSRKLRKPGDSLRIKNGGKLTLTQIDEDGLGHFEAEDTEGDVLKFTAQRNPDNSWAEIVKTKLNDVPATAMKFLKPGLGEWNPKWATGFKDAMMTEHQPLSYEARDALGTRGRIDVITHLANDLKQSRREAAELARHAARVKVRHGKLPPLTQSEYNKDIEFVSNALQNGLRLEKPQGSSLHHLLQYIENCGGGDLPDEPRTFINENFQSMVIEHDWAQAFDGVQGMDDDGDIPMPFDFTCFEFRVSGLRQLVMMGLTVNGGYEGILCTGVNGRWYVNAEKFKFIDGKFVGGDAAMMAELGVHMTEFLAMLGRQIRAVCIMLDAGVAEDDVQDAPERLNRKRREQGKVELKAYHVVRLGNRHRKQHVRGEGESDRRRPRMHIRRGHWRHYQVGTGHVQYTDDDGHLRSKTWINWMLIGDPDLGFVDKEYRL